MIPSPEETLEAWLAGELDKMVAQVLAPIIGEPFSDFGRVADIVWMGFGDEVPAPTAREPERQMARHRIHVQCPLRVDSPSAVLIATSDMYRSADNPDSFEEFSWSQPGANLFDVSVAAYWSYHCPGSARVTGVQADPLGGLELLLSNGQAIRIFPSTSGVHEHWRYFEADADDHFVVLEHGDGPA